MDLGFGLNLNSYTSPKGSQSFGAGAAPTKEQATSFESQMKSQNANTKGFAGKPIPTPGEGSIGAPTGPAGSFFPSNSVERVIPQVGENLSGPQSVANQKVDGLTRRVAWQRFLQKMKSELNVSAEEVLLAFQSLTPQELQQPPEENINKLVENLGLNPEQSQIASHLFHDLIEKTGSRPLAQELKTSKRDINLTVMSQRDQEQKKMSEALEKMNQEFFMKNQPAQASPTENDKEMKAGMVAQAQPVAKPQVNQIERATQPDRTISFETLQSGEEVGPDLLAQMTPVSEKESAELTQKLAKDGTILPEQDQVPEEQVQKEQTPIIVADAENTLEAQNLLKDPTASMNQTTEVSSVEGEDDSLSRIFEKALNATSEAKPKEKVVNKSSAKNTDLFSKGGDTAYASSVPVENLSEAVVDKSTFSEALGGAGATLGNNKTVSTEDLIQQARMMIRDGGGEVKVIMEPEGLGEVAMKVTVDGGNVNVEMVTESDIAKKMLEKGMGDLRSHLQASHLNLESIKVDTASNLGQQLEQQYQDAQRNQAQQFMEQFRQGNQEARRGFFDLPGAKLYQSQTKAIAPEVQSSGSSKSSQGRRLNLVA